jgi:hypothetical protein
MIDVQYHRQLIGIRNTGSGVDSSRFYQAVQGINQQAAQLSESQGDFEKSQQATLVQKQPAIEKDVNASGSVSKDKNIQKSYNKSTNPALSNEALLKGKSVATDKKTPTKAVKKDSKKK